MPRRPGTKNKNTLEKAAKDFIIILYALQPYVNLEYINSVFLDKFGYEISEEQLKLTISSSLNKIRELQLNGALLREQAEEVGLITLTSKLNRIRVLEDLVRKSIHGHPFEVQTARGDVLTINKKDFITATNAIKAIREEVGEDDNGQATYVINISEAAPPKTPEDEELKDEECI
ncbi:hypothetical protein ACQFX9_14345 [Aliinostoc sp. HNIBRCY26]|uniref:hypothetical protein n=1 Tax=Aliinostoc sp. HNIBRCY26 TaxID=3418997 RepID=UPI003CFCED4C